MATERPRRLSHPDVAAVVEASGHLRGYHAHEWDRFTIEAPTFRQAGEVAALLGWWLHCWQWQEADRIAIIDHGAPDDI